MSCAVGGRTCPQSGPRSFDEASGTSGICRAGRGARDRQCGCSMGAGRRAGRLLPGRGRTRSALHDPVCRRPGGKRCGGERQEGAPPLALDPERRRARVFLCLPQGGVAGPEHIYRAWRTLHRHRPDAGELAVPPGPAGGPLAGPRSVSQPAGRGRDPERLFPAPGRLVGGRRVLSCPFESGARTTVPGACGQALAVAGFERIADRTPGMTGKRRPAGYGPMLMALLLVPVCAWPELTVIYDAGQTRPLAPYLEILDDPEPEPDSPSMPEPRLGAADVRALLPIRSPGLAPGPVQARSHERPFSRPFFLIGSDPRSRKWLVRHREYLGTIGAMGLLVQAETVHDLQAMATLADSLPVTPAPGTDLAAALGLAHYPVLVTADGIRQ